MKALFCSNCMDLRALPPGRRRCVQCRCGVTCGWWEDPVVGVARFASANGYCWFLGLNNQYLMGALRAAVLDDRTARELHDISTDAPHHHFDKSRKNCWAILLRPGTSSDTSMVTEAPIDLRDRPDWLPVEQVLDEEGTST